MRAPGSPTFRIQARRLRATSLPRVGFQPRRRIQRSARRADSRVAPAQPSVSLLSRDLAPSPAINSLTTAPTTSRSSSSAPQVFTAIWLGGRSSSMALGPVAPTSRAAHPVITQTQDGRWSIPNRSAPDSPILYGGTEGHACFVRADVDAFTGKWLCRGLTATAAAGYTGKYASSGLAGSQSPPTDMPRMGVYAFRNLHGTLDGRAITLPIVLYGARDAGGYSALGEVPSMRFCPISEVGGASIGSDLALGAETWRVFPSCLVRVA